MSVKNAARLSLIFLLATLLSGCSARHPIPLPDESRPPIQNHPIPEQVHPPAHARAQAASELIRQARQLLAVWQPDHAINLLERAVNLNPSSGQNYYYLAQAWLMKGDVRQAMEFNSLAEIYVIDDSFWESQVAEQKMQIDHLAANPYE